MSPDMTSLGEKVVSTFALVPLAEERMQISNLVSDARRVCLSEDLFKALQWTLFHRIASVEQNLDAIPDLDRPIWIEFPNSLRTRHMPPEMLEGKFVPARVGFLFASSGNDRTFTMAVLYDDGTIGSIPDVTAAVGHFAVDEMAHLALRSRDTYRITNEACMRRIVDRARITIPLGFQKEMEAASDGRSAVLSRAYASALQDLEGEVAFALTCLLGLSCTNVVSTKGRFDHVETLNLGPPGGISRILSGTVGLLRKREKVGFARLGHPIAGRLSLDVPDLAEWTFDPVGYLKAGADGARAASNLPNEGARSSANA
jgi:hypothetical protein